MTREQRLRAALPGAGDDLIGRLAALPAGVVSDVVTAAKQAHRRGRAHEVAVRRQRKADRRNHGHIEDDQQAGATARMLGATARRAGQSLDALAALAQFEHSIPELKRVAVADLRAQGYSDPEIAEALGISRQAVGQTFGRKAGFTQDDAAS